MSLGTAGAYRVGGARQCSSMKRGYPWQPCEQPLPGTIILNNSVEYLLTNTNLALTSSRREGREKPKHKMACKQQAKYLQQHFAKKCKQATAYTSHEVPLLEEMGHPLYSWKNCWSALLRG